MARHTGEAVLQLIHSAANSGGYAVNDRDLLRRFVEQQDQTAFAALVRRHTEMVLGVCRRALPTVQDAEDACQATFLVLAQKARAHRWQPSVANWLFTTARHVARNALAAARRRARREARAAVPEAVQPVDKVTGRELLTALDEELDQLPPRYREPLVLCYLEGLTRDEAAVRLGVPAATLKTRLERGRKRLGDALTRRGCALGAGLLALAATSPAGASPPRFIASVLASASGSPPAAVAALTRGVAVNGMNKLLLLALALVGTALSVGLGALTFAGQKPEPPPTQAAEAGRKETPLPPSEKGTTVSGRVLDPDGKPAPGAPVYLVGRKKDGVEAKPQRIATTDADGRFTFDARRAPAGLRGAVLVATAPGAAPDWGTLNEPGPEMTLRLTGDVPIRGRLLDLEGKPVAGALVKVVSVGAFRDGNLQPAFNAMKLNPEWLSFDKRIIPFAPAFAFQTRTAADGRFTLTGLGRDRVAVLRFEAPGVEAAEVHVVTRPDFDPSLARPGPKDVATLNKGFVPGLRLAVYGPTFTHSARPSHDITGTVTDAATGRPVADVTVVGTAGNQHFTREPYWGNTVQTRTDREGRFRLSGLPKAASRYLHLRPGDSPYLDRVIEVKDVPGLAPVAVEVKLEGCVVIEGRLTDKVTGKPILGQAHYLPMKDNSDLKTLADPGLYKGGLFSARPTGTWAYTDDDGRFQLRVLHGLGLILARADTDRDPAARYTAIRVAEGDRKYLQKRDPDARSSRMTRGAKTRDRSQDDQAFDTGVLMWPLRWENGYAVINPGAGDRKLTVSIGLDPGQTVTGSVVGPDGKPVAGVKAVGVQATDERLPTTFRGTTFTVYALEPGRPRELFLLHDEKKLVGTITVRAGDKAPVVQLQPCAVLTGRVLNPDGTPAVGAEVGFQFIDGLADELIRQKLHQGGFRRIGRADKDGRFRLEGMVPGQEVWVSANGPGLRFGTGSQPVIPKPGETVDVGDLKIPASRE
jgi:RNA polymerase sigma factor (sigma-70 family)